MRLIDADAFKKYMRDACNEMSHVYKDGGKWAKQITEDFCMDIDEQPTIEPERTEYIADTKALPSNRDCVDLSESVTATYYDDEHEEWSKKTVTIRDVLDSVCDDYTVIEPERKKGTPLLEKREWIEGYENRWYRKKFYCASCGIKIKFESWDEKRCFGKGTILRDNNMPNFCPNCGAEIRTPVETARDIVHTAIDNSVWSDTVDVSEMHKVVDDKYAEMEGRDEFK